MPELDLLQRGETGGGIREGGFLFLVELEVVGEFNASRFKIIARHGNGFAVGTAQACTHDFELLYHPVELVRVHGTEGEEGNYYKGRG